MPKKSCLLWLSSSLIDRDSYLVNNLITNGYGVKLAGQATDAMGRCNAADIKLLIWPTMESLDACVADLDALRANPEFANIPCLVVRVGALLEYQDFKLQDWLNCPWATKSILRTVNTLMANNSKVCERSCSAPH